MSFTFNGTSSRWHASNPPVITGANSGLIFGKRTVDGNFDLWLGLHDADGVGKLGIETMDAVFGNKVSWYNGSNGSWALDMLVADGWCAFGWSVAAGFARLRFHKWSAADGFQHEDGLVDNGAAGSARGGTFRVGDWEGGDWLHGKVTAQAIWARQMSDVEWEGLVTAASVDALENSQPARCYAFKGASALGDIAGSDAPEILRENVTEDTGDDFPDFDFVLSPPTLAPLNTTAPSLSGLQEVGETLTCDRGAWLRQPHTFAYQWLRNGDVIAGATAQTYEQTTRDGGQEVTCRVTATNIIGSTVAVSDVADPPRPQPTSMSLLAKDGAWTARGRYVAVDGFWVALEG